MKRAEREKVIRGAYRSTIVALSICCIFLGAVLVVHELAREYEVSELEEKLEAKGVVQNDEGLYASVELFLPDEIYVATGVTIELYNSQVSSLGTRIENYNVKWTCAVGKNMSRKFSVTGTEKLIGDYQLIFTIFDDNGAQVATASTTLKIVEALEGEESSFSLLTIGDSLSCDTATYERLNELSDDGIIYMGTRGVGGSLTEARRGFSAADYLSATPYTQEEPEEEVQPFYNEETGSFDWAYYKETTGFDPDAVEIFLGTNGIDTDPVPNGDNIIAIVENIHEADPDLPIYLVHTIYPANQDGIGSWSNSDGYALYGDRYKYEEDQKVFYLMTYLEETLKDEDNLYFVPAAICHDSENNFNTTTEAVNPHSDETIEVPDNAVHPNSAGYQQIADCLYSVICGTKAEWEN
ncbi:MAG: SGNH/GDSL hydrolase family protein [Lachnospiraceae bacterium]|nr:SGNH/GDSL hydrolase family protein [Lachnospiraceae bacterium]